MGILNFHKHTDRYCSPFLGGVRSKGGTAAAEALVVDGLCYLTSYSYGALQATTFTDAFVTYFLRLLTTRPHLKFLVYACDHSAQVTRLKAHTQQKRRQARPTKDTDEDRLRETELAKQEGVLSVRASDGAVLLSGAEAHHLVLPMLVTVRAARKAIFTYLLGVLRKDPRVLSLLKKTPELVLCLDMGLGACTLWREGAWSEHKEGVWGPTGQGEADVTTWLWASRLLGQGAKSLTFQTIDTDFVIIGLLFLLRREAADKTGPPVPTTIEFKGREDWDLARLFTNLREKKALLPFVWAHAAMGTDFVPKKQVSFRVPFPLVFRAAQNLVVRLDREGRALRDACLPEFCHFMLWICRYHGEKLKLLPPAGVVDPFVLHHTWITTRSSASLPPLDELPALYGLFNSVLWYWYFLDDPSEEKTAAWAAQARAYLDKERPSKRRRHA